MKKSIQKYLGVMFDDLKNSFSYLFPGLLYFVKVTQVKKSIYILIRRKCGKNLVHMRQKLLNGLKTFLNIYIYIYIIVYIYLYIYIYIYNSYSRKMNL